MSGGRGRGRERGDREERWGRGRKGRGQRSEEQPVGLGLLCLRGTGTKITQELGGDRVGTPEVRGDQLPLGLLPALSFLGVLGVMAAQCWSRQCSGLMKQRRMGTLLFSCVSPRGSGVVLFETLHDALLSSVVASHCHAVCTLTLCPVQLPSYGYTDVCMVLFVDVEMQSHLNSMCINPNPTS